MPDRRVVVVGAGAAGLTAAGALHPAFVVVVVDKGRGVGGRLATRRIGEATFDHGAQFFTTHTDRFADTVAGWMDAGVARAWFHGRAGPDGIPDPDGHVRYRGVVAMTSVAKHLARGLDVRVGVRVTALERSGNGWLVRTDGEALECDAVVATAPVPQTLALLAAGGVDLATDDRAALSAIRYDPCLAVLAPLHGPSGLPAPGAVDPDRGPIDWIADNQVKGVSATPAVIHATAAFSRAHRKSSDTAVAAELLAASGLASRPIDGQVQVQRWRYARPTVLHPERCLVADLPALLVCAGDAFGGAKVEGAVLSGLAASDAVSRLLGGDA